MNLKAIAPPAIDRGAFDQVRSAPRAFERHFTTALALYTRADRTDADLHYARAGFETAWRLSGDFWPALAFLGLTFDSLGYHHQAMDAFIQAAQVSDHATLWRAAAISALKARYEAVAYSLYRRSKTAATQVPDSLAAFLDAAYLGGDGRGGRIVKPPDSAGSEERQFACYAAMPGGSRSGDDEEDDGGSGGRPDDLPPECREVNLLIDTFVIRRVTESSSRVGIDLLSTLQLQFGAVLMDFQRAGSGEAFQSTIARAAKISIPEVSYALSVASDKQSATSITASPSILARLGQTSEIFEGTEIFIVAAGSDGSSEFEKEIGVKLVIEPTGITNEVATLRVSVTFSNLAADIPTSSSFRAFNTEKLNAVVNGSFPYGRAVILGTLSSLAVADSRGGQTGLKSVPLLGSLFGTDAAAAENRELAVMAVVRLPPDKEPPVDRIQIGVIKAYGLEAVTQSFKRYGFIHDAPRLDSVGSSVAAELGGIAGLPPAGRDAPPAR